MIDDFRFMILVCVIATVMLNGCNSQSGTGNASMQDGGQYNTNREVESFFEPKLADGTIRIGMDQSAFVAVCGQPAYKERRTEGEMIREIWRYGNLGGRSYRYGYKIYLFTFENGMLQSWRG